MAAATASAVKAWATATEGQAQAPQSLLLVQYLTATPHPQVQACTSMANFPGVVVLLNPCLQVDIWAGGCACPAPKAGLYLLWQRLLGGGEQIGTPSELGQIPHSFSLVTLLLKHTHRAGGSQNPSSAKSGVK